MSENELKIEKKLDRISERVYWQSFAFFCLVVLTAVIGTGLLRYYKDIMAELIPKNVLDFTERVIWVYVIPITVKLIKESIPELVLLFQEIRLMKASILNVPETQAQPPLQPAANPEVQMGGISNVNNG